ncbi:hypothetical protein [Bacteroides sp.]|uniref:hypothetical protein n=1 Tax=Bacteroides sp. TaxID=29523 RepID=UPI00261A6113|nr:hypothetical protein [Bacteroides sp.]MDD3036559.1 hypothetical protein [Bacteroides sp.]
MKLMTSFLLLIAASCIHAQQSNQSAESIFQKYFQQAQVFSTAYPQEKVHLHFDNTSYYCGDTIWFKAYVTQGPENQPTTLSQPLYVELLDQLGHIVNKQIVKVQQGEGQGQFILEKSGLSGYYEVRAFTKWMLSFGDEYYFSRTFPVYRPQVGDGNEDRSITTYNMHPSMKQRPKDDTGKLAVRFFPEGGQLIEGVTSIIAFKAESKNEGAVSVSGLLRTKQGEELTEFETLHDGMGCLSYTPRAGVKVEAIVNWNGDKYTFQLPKALPEGYMLSVTNRETTLDVRVMRNEATLSDTLALFISHQGIPLIWNALRFGQKQAELLRIPIDQLPGGIIQLSLMNRKGNVLAERSCYIMPKTALQLTAQTDRSYYHPFSPIRCKIEAKDEAGKPLETNLSVSIRSTLQSDYLEYDNTLYTDLLLTSELKGYIHQPGYYFAGNTRQRKQELDVLMLVHGWRKYDLPGMVSEPPAQPRYLPEKSLTIHGQLKSFILKNNKDNLEVSILSKKEGEFRAGKAMSDSIGRFQIPVQDFEGIMPTNIQTSKPGSGKKQLCSVLLFRNFSPELRRYDFYESHPEWQDVSQLRNTIRQKDSLYMDSIRKSDPFFLDEVTVQARYLKKRTLLFEKSIDVYYDVQSMVDKMRDEGKEIFTLYDFLNKVNPQIRLEEGKRIMYREKFLPLVVDGKILRAQDRFLIEEDIDAVKTLVISSGSGARDELRQLDFEDVLTPIEEGFAEPGDETAATEGTNGTNTQPKGSIGLMDEPTSIAYIVSADGWDANKDFRPSRGVRLTRIQGYTRPLEFYSPAYTEGILPQGNDRRRTIYWNPNVKTDKNGCVVIECNNTNRTTPLTISVETLSDGKPGAVVMHSIGL